MRTTTIQLFKLNELEDSVRTRVIERYRHYQTEGVDWWDHVYEDARNIATLMGIDIQDIFFGQLYCQGEGARFHGSYSAPDFPAEDKVKDYAPQDEDLHRIAKRLDGIQAKHGRKVESQIQLGTGQGEQAWNTIIENIVEPEDVDQESYVPDEDAELDNLFRDFMNWILERLKDENEHLTSDDVVIESLQDHEFLANGENAPSQLN